MIALGRAMVLRWPLGTINDDMGRSGGRPRPPMRSNEWAVAPRRSADGSAILLADPHLTWEGLAVLYEARVHAGPLHGNGFFLIGSPLLAVGHNRHVGWALTTGGPDVADVFRMTIRRPQDDPDGMEYQYDDTWRRAERKVFNIAVQGDDSVVRPAYFTHLGPVIGNPDWEEGVAYVGAAPLLNKTKLMEQAYRMCCAADGDAFYDAIGMGEFNPQNIMFADVGGDIRYVRTGATPIRPDGYDWDAPVPGNTSRSAWQGLHPIGDLVQVVNPACGFMQNCNISPENMMPDSPLRHDRYRDYIFNVSWDTDNPRSMRIRQLLDHDRSVTRDEAIQYAMDVNDVLASLWQRQLRLAVEQAANDVAGNRTLQAAVQALLDWNGEFTREATCTSLYERWRLRCGEEIDLRPMAEQARPP